MGKKVILMILDGWGIAPNPEVSAITKANTPFMDSLLEEFSWGKLNASGLAVGLPDGQMGNSEVGHMNLGAGRVVYQDLVKLNKAVEEKTLDEKNKELREKFIANSLKIVQNYSWEEVTKQHYYKIYKRFSKN